MKVCIATGSSVYKNTIRQKKLSVRKLFEELSEPKIRKEKDGPYFIFASFKGHKRNADSVIKYYGATIDLDDTLLSVDEICEMFEGYKYLIHTTHSHQDYDNDKGDRYRLILPYAEPLNKTAHVQLMLAIMAKLGIENVDLSSKALSRPMYLPACPDERRFEFECITNLKGRYVSGDDFELSLDDQWALEQLDSEDIEASRFDINDEIIEGGRNDGLASLVGTLINSGANKKTLLKTAHTWNEANCVPPLTGKEVKTIVKSVYGSHQRNHNDTDWGFEETKSRIEEQHNPKESYNKLIKLAATTKGASAGEMDELVQLIKKRTGTTVGPIKEDIKNNSDEHKQEKKKESKEFVDENLRSAAKGIKRNFRQWVYLCVDDRVFNITKGIKPKPEGFNRHYSHIMLDEKLEGKVLELLLKFDSIKQADTLQYHPGGKEIFTEDKIVYANTYRKPDLEPVKGSVKPMIDHIKFIIPDPTDRQHFLRFIAWMFQNPGKKQNWMPIIKATKGVGKSMIESKFITPMLGVSNVKPVDIKTLKSDFNSGLLDCQLAVIHEMKLGGSRKDKIMLTDSLKEIITERYMMAHRKGLDMYKVPNRLTLIGFTDSDDFIMITDDERRFFAMRCDEVKKPDSYYQELLDWADKEENQEAMLYYWQNKSTENHNPYVAPENDYTRQVKGQSNMWPNSILTEALKDQQHPFNKIGVSSWGAIVEYIKSESSGQDYFRAEELEMSTSSTGYVLRNALNELGFRLWNPGEKPDSRIRIDGDLTKVWLAPNFISEYKNRNSVAIRNILANEKTVYDFDGVNDDDWEE